LPVNETGAEPVSKGDEGGDDCWSVEGTPPEDGREARGVTHPPLLVNGGGVGGSLQLESLPVLCCLVNHRAGEAGYNPPPISHTCVRFQGCSFGPEGDVRIFGSYPS